MWGKWSHPWESNPRPTDYESVALPTELGWPSLPLYNNHLAGALTVEGGKTRERRHSIHDRPGLPKGHAHLSAARMIRGEVCLASSEALMKTANRDGLVVEDLKHRVKLGDLQKIMHTLGELQ